MEEKKGPRRSYFFDRPVFCGMSGAGIVGVGQGRRGIFLGKPWGPEFFASIHASENDSVSNAGNDAKPGIGLR